MYLKKIYTLTHTKAFQALIYKQQSMLLLQCLTAEEKKRQMSILSLPKNMSVFKPGASLVSFCLHYLLCWYNLAEQKMVMHMPSH